MISLTHSKEQPYGVAALLGGANWRGMDLDNQYQDVNGFSLGLDFKYKYLPHLHTDFGTLISNEWNLFSPGYTPENNILLTFIENGTHLNYWKFEFDTGISLGLAYKTGPGKRIEMENKDSNERCLIMCFSEDIKTRPKDIVDPIYCFYWNILINIEEIAIGWKFRKLKDRETWYLNPAFFVEFQFGL